MSYDLDWLENEESKNVVPERKSKPAKESSRPAKLIVPNYIKNLFDNLDKSISSAWGMQKNGKIKWDSKYNQWETFKLWFMEVSK